MQSRPCTKCKYDLKGLRIGGNCPECGELIRAKRKSFGPREGTMTDAPPAYVKQVGLGFTVMSLGIVAVIAGVPLSCFVPYALLGAVLLGSLAWAAGTWIISMPRPTEFAEHENPIMDSPRWRLGVRVASAMWILYLLLAIGAVAAEGVGVLEPTLLIAAGLAGLAAFIGLVPLSVYVAEIEFWMSDDTGGWQLRGAAWAILVFGVLFIVMSAIAPFLGFWCLIVLLVATGVLGWHILGCANRTRWVLKYQQQNEGRSERITERLRDRSERGGTVAGSMPCLECGYELRGLPYGGRCPECGTSYADLTPFPILSNPVKDETPIDLDDSGHSETIRPAVQHIGKRQPHGTPPPPPPPPPLPRDDSPIPLDGDEDLPEDFQDPPPAPPPAADVTPPPRSTGSPDDDGPIPLADDDRP
jgi:hypothetical protein